MDYFYGVVRERLDKWQERNPNDDPYLVAYFIKKPKNVVRKTPGVYSTNGESIDEFKRKKMIVTKTTKIAKRDNIPRPVSRKTELKYETIIETYNSYSCLETQLDGEFHFLEELPDTNVISVNYKNITTKLIKEKPNLDPLVFIGGKLDKDIAEYNYDETICEVIKKKLISTPYTYYQKPKMVDVSTQTDDFIPKFLNLEKIVNETNTHSNNCDESEIDVDFYEEIDLSSSDEFG